MKILIVNDSSVLTSVIRAVVETEEKLTVVATAVNGIEAINMVSRYLPDLVLMDIHMPKMDGVEATRRIIQARPKTRILITSATISRNMKHIFTTLQHGALDYVHSPSLTFRPGTPVSTAELQRAGAAMMQKVRTVLKISDSKVKSLRQLDKAPPMTAAVTTTEARKSTPKILAIGCSTGGPTTVVTLLKHLRYPFPAPILICQHIDQEFTQGFVSWLAEQTGIPASIARAGVVPQAGHIYVAPGGQQNLELLASGQMRLVPPQKEHIYLPNISHLFSSMANSMGAVSCGVVLTGMGDDGAAGVAKIKEAGGVGFAQDAQSAVIDSMPKAARIALKQAVGQNPFGIANQLNALFKGGNG